MNKKRIIQIGIIIFVIVFVAICIVIVQFSKHDLEEAKKDLQKTQEKYGWVEKESVDVLVAKFNTQVMDNDSSSLNPASTDYLVEENNQYWYGLIEGIYLVVIPEKYTGDKTADIVDKMLIYVQTSTKYENDVQKYVKYLIKANNEEITNSDIETLLKGAKDNASAGKTSNNGKGISVGFLQADNHYEYQVIRLFK